MSTEHERIAQPVRLVPATAELLESLTGDGTEFERVLGDRPAGWPEFPEAIPRDLERLRGDPEPGWTMHFVVERASGVLAGSGGFVSVPRDDSVEIGYEIAPAFRGRGVGRAAAAALVALAFARGIRRVVAHTLPEPTASSRVLTALGFRPADGGREGTWRWELSYHRPHAAALADGRDPWLV